MRSAQAGAFSIQAERAGAIPYERKTLYANIE